MQSWAPSMRSLGFFSVLVTMGARVVLGQTDSEAGDEEESLNPVTQSSTVMVILSCMIAFSILFENVREYVEEHTKENLKPVLNSLFGELTLLGFIGLTLFIVDKIDALQTLSDSLFGEEGAIGELCESVHMALFLVMVLFLTTVLLLVHIGNSISTQWSIWEERIIAEHHVRSKYDALVKQDLGLSHALVAVEPLQFQEAAYAAVRRGFIAELTGEYDVDDHFDFAGYLDPMLGHVLAEFVEIPPTTWLMLEGVLVVMWLMYLHTSPVFQAGLFLLVGYGLPLTLRVVHGKIRLIKADVILSHGFLAHFATGDRVLQPPRQGERTGLLSAPVEEAPTGGQREPHPLATVMGPTRYDPESLSGHYGQSHLGHENHKHRFWWGGRYKASFMMGLLRKSLLVNSIYLALLILLVLPAVLDSDRHDLAKGVFLVAALLPSSLLAFMVPGAVQDFVLVTSILSMKNKRVLEHTIRRIKTRQCFLTLKVIYMMVSGVEKKGHHGDGQPSTPRHEHLPPEEDLSADELRKRRLWKNIFDVIDDDNSGRVNQDELSRQLHKMVPAGMLSERDVLNIMQQLDEDQSGEIDFHEFLEYADYVTNGAVGEPEEVARGMFSLVVADVGGEGVDPHHATINIKQLQGTLQKLGQELSADDVYNVIKDIDENGDGQLDLEEFETLLRLLQVI